MAPWRRIYPLVPFTTRIGPYVHGETVVRRPLLSVRLLHDRRPVRGHAPVDTGADFAYLPGWMAALLDIDVSRVGVSEHWIAGISGGLRVSVVEVEVTILDSADPQQMLLPVLVPMEPDERFVGGRVVRPPLVIGRHPFFSRFAVAFEPGPTRNSAFPSWTLATAAA